MKIERPRWPEFHAHERGPSVQIPRFPLDALEFGAMSRWRDGWPRELSKAWMVRQLDVDTSWMEPA